jgi:hypothetical protein
MEPHGLSHEPIRRSRMWAILHIFCILLRTAYILVLRILFKPKLHTNSLFEIDIGVPDTLLPQPPGQFLLLLDGALMELLDAFLPHGLLSLHIHPILLILFVECHFVEELLGLLESHLILFLLLFDLLLPLYLILIAFQEFVVAPLDFFVILARH